MVETKIGKSYSAPMLILTTFACEDVVRTSDQNLGGIPTTWHGFSPEVFDNE